MAAGRGGRLVLPRDGKAEVQAVERPGPGGGPDGLEVPPVVGCKLRRRGQVLAFDAPHEVAPFTVEPIPEPEGVELPRAPVSAHVFDPVDALRRGAGRVLDNAVGSTNPVGSQEAVVVALGGDLGPRCFPGPAKGGKGAGAPVPPAKFPARLGGQCIEGGEGIRPPPLGKREQGEDAEEAFASVFVRNAFDPLERRADPVLLCVSESDAPGRESVQSVRNGRSVLRNGLPGAGGGIRGAPGDRGDGGGDRLLPLWLAPDPPRPGDDPGGAAIVPDPAFGDGPVRLIEPPGDVGGESPVAALEGDLDPMPEMLRGPASLARPERERAVARLVLRARNAPEPRRGLESRGVVSRLEERSRVKALATSLHPAKGERRAHLQETGPAMLSREAVEPEAPDEVGHRCIGNGREECLDRRFVVPAESAAEFQVLEPRVKRMISERLRQAGEARPLPAPQRAPRLQDHDPLDGRPGDRRFRGDGPGFEERAWQDRAQKEEDRGPAGPDGSGGGRADLPPDRIPAAASSGHHRTEPSGPAPGERTRTTEEDMERLTGLMARLRQDCPWDRAQTFETIVPCTIEEAYEVADAIAREDFDSLREELGDLLFQVVFYAHLANERGRFDIEDVVDSIVEKMIRRHPHVFDPSAAGDGERPDWERAKARERPRSESALDGLPAALPALARAAKLQRRAAAVGFDWPDVEGVFDKLDEEIAELREALDAGEGTGRVESELGDILFTCVNLARRLDLDGDRALAGANRRFERRFRVMESLAGRGRRLDERTPAELDALWEQVKK